MFKYNQRVPFLLSNWTTSCQGTKDTESERKATGFPGMLRMVPNHHFAAVEPFGEGPNAVQGDVCLETSIRDPRGVS